jgi:hypothetical protein
MPSKTSVDAVAPSLELSAIAQHLARYDQHSARRFSGRLLAEYPDTATLVATFDTNEFWGGAGSLADQGMFRQTTSEIPPEYIHARRDYWTRMARFGRFLLSAGASNPRILMWVEVFEKWCRDGI